VVAGDNRYPEVRNRSLLALKTNIILIDFENVQPTDLTPLRGRAFKAKVFCGATQSKIPLSLAAELQPRGPEAEYIRIQGTGRNALDFHIAYYIGRLSTELPGAIFHIVSRDTGFDPLIKHLKTQNVICHRWGSLGDIPGLAPVNQKALPERLQKIANNLLRRGASRPRTLKTLTSSIKSLLGARGTESDVGEVIAQLSRHGAFAISDSKVIYPQAEPALKGPVQVLLRV